ncbi:conserved Plasmodium protein, unknown function [Plasmodium knowlesi strain H]|uniref:Uncharacterized protein n=2 Tax=Plasmodium knowlesi TaxID=5850 RepID=B3LCS9_PLAKH|nr:conserved Plasmodium protein, unknown function [Plasmodium knowlesi strain H]OTN63651.1 Uncharacterized protein PKNOH_S140266400 [Plasmodium knowlesi]CAA9991078.1 conserved Plasmodium protein, unknown function [Plasmodium knowlesi strain H]VVS80552.1 conserved Plasmodium protein, unknown function [Plasmodium knowlesi strain H]|eukprot:XP_002262360.1 hypothetical protein, conserved in Plasmodium species [Plasmodium knowlesi strain H]
MNAVRKCPSRSGSSKSILFRSVLSGGTPERKNNHHLIHHVRKSPFYTSVVVHNFDLRANQHLLLSNATIVNDEKALLNGCLNFMKNFESFAAICCACNDPKNKVQLKKSIWFSSIGIEMQDFIQYCYEGGKEFQNDEIKKILEEIVKSECPVILRDKNSVLIEPDVAPKKIVNSAKRMRYFFNISEVHTCRSCHQKSRCKRFLEKYTGEPDFSDFTRLMIGFYHVSKAYTRRNEMDRLELRHVIEKVNYFHFALLYMYNYLLKHKHFNYNTVEEGNRSAILTYLRERRRNFLLLKNQREQEKIMNIPKEYSDVMIPTEKAKMKRRQRNVFERLQRFRRRSQLPEDEEKFIWMEEQEEEEDTQERASPADSYDGSLQKHSTINNDLKNDLHNITEDENSLVEIKENNEPLASFRFHYMAKMNKHGAAQEISNYNKMYNKYSRLLQKNVCINLDDHDVNEDIIKAESLLFKIPEAIGGYTFINYIERQPNNFILPINENLYKGIQVYKREELNLGDFWSNITNEELKIKRVGFYNPFNIKQSLEIAMQKKGAHPRRETAQEKDEEITDLSDDLSSFQEYLDVRKKSEAKRRRGERRRANLENSPSYATASPVDERKSKNSEENNDEDARFAYFKKLRNERFNVDQYEEVKEEFDTIYNEAYTAKGERDQAYHHTHHIRRRLTDEEKGQRGVTPEDIQEERRRLMQEGRRELKEMSFYLFKNVKFPELPAELSSGEGLSSGEKKRKNLNDELKKYIRPRAQVDANTQKRNSNVPELTEETIQAHCSSSQGSRSLEIMLKKKRKNFKGDRNVQER